MTHVQQRSYMDCGVAAIAMLTNVDYERVLASVPPDVAFYGLYYGEIVHAISKISKRDWQFRELEVPCLLREFEFPYGSKILAVDRTEREIFEEKHHYIYTDGLIVSDPIEDSFQTVGTFKSSYKGDWEVKALISLK